MSPTSVVPKHECTSQSPPVSDSVELEWSPWISISNTFPSYINAAGLGTTLWKPLSTSLPFLPPQSSSWCLSLSLNALSSGNPSLTSVLLKLLFSNVSVYNNHLGDLLTKQISYWTLKHWFLVSAFSVNADDPRLAVCEILAYRVDTCLSLPWLYVVFAHDCFLYHSAIFLCVCLSPTRVPKGKGLCLSHNYNLGLSTMQC